MQDSDSFSYYKDAAEKGQSSPHLSNRQDKFKTLVITKWNEGLQQ